MELPNDMSRRKLLKFTKEHLSYEIEMLYYASDVLLNNRPQDYCLFSVLLESFVIHTSNLMDFFYKPQKKGDDARAVHFFDSPRKWYEVRPRFTRSFEKFINKRNKRVVHLSYKRLEIEGEGRGWQCAKVTAEVRKVVDAFLENANPRLLHGSIHRLHSKNITGKTS